MLETDVCSFWADFLRSHAVPAIFCHIPKLPHPPPLRNLTEFRIHQPIGEEIKDVLGPPKFPSKNSSLSPWERVRVRVDPLSLRERVRVRA
jgi:hypothetical protein